VKKLFLVVLAIVGLAVLPTVGEAAAITGTLNIGGSVQVSATTIDWFPLSGGTGQVTTGFPGTQYFASIFAPSAPDYQAIAIDLTPANPPPVPMFLSHFVTPNPEYNDLSFTLEGIIMPTAPPCPAPPATQPVDVPCSFGVFTLKQTPGGNVDVSFDIRGSFVDPTFGDLGNLNDATGIYTTQLAQTTIAQIIATISAGRTIGAKYSATFTANAVPEPATLLTFGAGTALLAAHRRRRAKKNNA
jgi:hypothetical protein